MINLITHLMKRGKGLAFVGGVIEGEYNETNVTNARKAMKQLKGTLRDRQIEGFPEVIVADSNLQGQTFLVQGKGFGVLRPNTVLLGFPQDVAGMTDTQLGDYAKIIQNISLARKTLLVCKGSEEFPSTQPASGPIDVWWVFDILPARGLLLLVPYLLSQHRVWKDTRLRLFVVTGYDEDKTTFTVMLENMLQRAGLKAEVVVLQMDAADAPRFTNVGGKGPARGQISSISAVTDYLSGIALELGDGDGEGEDKSKTGGEEVSADGTRRSRSESIASDMYGSRLTGVLSRHSGDSALVMLTLPKLRPDQSPRDYMASLDVLMSGLKRVILVQESGQERVQLYG